LRRCWKVIQEKIDSIFLEQAVNVKQKVENMLGIGIAGSIRVASILNTYLRNGTLSTRGVNRVHWLAIFWWADLELHIVLLKMNGSITSEEHYVISVTFGSGRRTIRRRV
jgi:hypothetical protein